MNMLVGKNGPFAGSGRVRAFVLFGRLVVVGDAQANALFVANGPAPASGT